MLRIKPGKIIGRGKDESTVHELYARVNEYLQDESFADAYPLLIKIIKVAEPTCATSSMAGLVAVRLGKHDEGREHFCQALESDPENYDARYNLALIDMLTGRFSAATREFRTLVLLRPGEANLRNDLGAALIEQKREARALASFSKALKIDPNCSQARNNALEHCLRNNLKATAHRILDRNEKSEDISSLSKAEINRWRQLLESPSNEVDSLNSNQAVSSTSISADSKPRLAFFANHDSFVSAIRKELDEEYEIRHYDGSGTAAMSELLDWADLSWFEWCDNLVIEASRLPKRSVMLCRLHSYEAFTDMPEKVQWQNIDHLLFVNDSVRQLVAPRIPQTVSQSVIHNGVDLHRFAVPESKLNSKKIASVGYINYKKNPTLLLYCFKKLHQYDPEYTLHIAGSHQDSRIQLYFEHFLKQNPLPVYFDGWIEDMPKWYADKGWVISTSLFESFHYSIAEGMACGLLPLIHNWFGADQLYPPDYLFSDPDQFLALVKSLESRKKGKLMDLNRKFIAERYDHTDKMQEIRVLLQQLHTRHLQKVEASV